MVEKSEYIKNKCSHCAARLILIGKDAHQKGNIRHIKSCSKAIASHFSHFLYIKISKNRKG